MTTNRIYNLLLALSLLCSCSSEVKKEAIKFEFEDLAYKCFIERFKAEGVDIELELKQFEAFLIREKRLKSTDNIDFDKFSKQLGDASVIEGLPAFYLPVFTFKKSFYFQDCILNVIKDESAKAPNGVKYLIEAYPIVNYDTPQDVKDVVRFFPKSFTPNHFTHPFYRSYALMYSYILHQEQLDVSTIRGVKITIDENRIWIGKREYPLEELSTELRNLKASLKLQKAVLQISKSSNHKFVDQVKVAIRKGGIYEMHLKGLKSGIK